MVFELLVLSRTTHEDTFMVNINPTKIFKRGMFYTLEGRPDTEGLVVFEDLNGVFYLKSMIKKVGFNNPFRSIEEIERTFETKMTLVAEDIFQPGPLPKELLN